MFCKVNKNTALTNKYSFQKNLQKYYTLFGRIKIIINVRFHFNLHKSCFSVDFPMYTGTFKYLLYEVGKYITMTICSDKLYLRHATTSVYTEGLTTFSIETYIIVIGQGYVGMLYVFPIMFFSRCLPCQKKYF